MVRGDLRAASVLALAVASAITGMASSAQAAEFVVMYKGTVANSYHFGLGANTFGQGGTSLNGMAFEARYVVNAPAPGINEQNTPVQSYYFGTLANQPNFVAASLKINGVTVAIPTSTATPYASSGDFLRYNSPSIDAIRTSAGYNQLGLSPSYVQRTDYINAGVATSNGTFWPTSGFSNSFSYDLLPGDQIQNVFGQNQGFSFFRYLYSGQFEEVGGSLRTTSVSLNYAPPVSPGVPEPASWALMIAGFGMAGTAMRRRAKVRITYA